MKHQTQTGKPDPLTTRCLAIAGGLLHNPTAPRFEDLPKAYIRQFVADRPALGCREDKAGNLLVRYRACGGRGTPVVLVAHMDHPGFRVEAVRGKTLRLRFQGYVVPPHGRAGQRIRLFRRGQVEPLGVAELTKVAYERNRIAQVSAKVVSGTAVEADFAMWDFPAYRETGGRIVACNCDDGMGTAAALCVLDEMVRRRPKNVVVQVLFTRAEELGFLGALEAIRLRTVPKRAVVISLEASKALPHAPQGGGVIVRVGDRESVFNPEVTHALQAAAVHVARRDPDFRFQRRLMDGGACEATPFYVAGYRASGVAIPLGNYHNQSISDNGTAGVGAEHVCIRDFVDEVRLLTEFVRHAEKYLKPNAALAVWLRKFTRTARKVLASKP